jgi:hypothetical protein
MNDYDDPEPLHSAARDGDVARPRKLLAEGHPVNAFAGFLTTE